MEDVPAADALLESEAPEVRRALTWARERPNETQRASLGRRSNTMLSPTPLSPLLGCSMCPCYKGGCFLVVKALSPPLPLGSHLGSLAGDSGLFPS